MTNDEAAQVSANIAEAVATLPWGSLEAFNGMTVETEAMPPAPPSTNAVKVTIGTEQFLVIVRRLRS